MGYRSDVFCQIKSKHLSTKMLINELAEEFKKINLTLNELFDEILVNKNTRCNLLFISRNVKWYPDFEDVSTFMNFIKEIGEEIENKYNNEGTVYYVRLGEDSDDIEEKIYGEYNVDVDFVRTVEYDTDDFKKLDM